MKRALPLLAAIALSSLPTESASAETYRVNDLPTLAKRVGETAEPGDILEVLPGTYYVEAPRIPVQRSGTPERPLVIRGVLKNGKRPVLDASKVNVQRCVIAVGPGVHDVVFENLDISNAAGSRSRARCLPGRGAGQGKDPRSWSRLSHAAGSLWRTDYQARNKGCAYS